MSEQTCLSKLLLSLSTNTFLFLTFHWCKQHLTSLQQRTQQNIVQEKTCLLIASNFSSIQKILRFDLTWAQSAEGELLWSPYIRRALCVRQHLLLSNHWVNWDEAWHQHPLTVLTRIPSYVLDPCRILVSMATKQK